MVYPAKLFRSTFFQTGKKSPGHFGWTICLILSTVYHVPGRFAFFLSFMLLVECSYVCLRDQTLYLTVGRYKDNLEIFIFFKGIQSGHTNIDLKVLTC